MDEHQVDSGMIIPLSKFTAVKFHAGRGVTFFGVSGYSPVRSEHLTQDEVLAFHDLLHQYLKERNLLMED